MSACLSATALNANAADINLYANFTVVDEAGNLTQKKQKAVNIATIILIGMSIRD